ncbi:MAG: hypothetical protein NVSMB60_08080 [Mycobacterium sp.]
MPTRKPFVSATLNGINVPNVLNARCSFGYDMMVSEAVVFVPVSPGFQLYDQNMILTMGAGTVNAVRFNGLFRRYDYSLYPRMLGLACFGNLVRAQQYENNDEGAGSYGGLDINDLTTVGTNSTDQNLVGAVLARVPRLTYVAGNLGGTGTMLGTQLTSIHASPFLWRNGRNPSIKIDVGGKGEGALDYIQRIDAISAVYTSATAPAGFYRTYEQIGGTIRRSLLGSRPRGVVDYTFTEGVDIWQGSSNRAYPIANRVYVQGFDYGKPTGPSSNLNSPVLQSNNPFMPQSEKHTYTFSSPLIEKGLFSEAGLGMDCETVASAILLDVNRETVRCDFTTTRDDLIGPGSTVLVQGPGGAPDRLGIGENMWVTHVDVTVDTDGSFSQRLTCIGGGLPDNYTPAPPL